MLRARIDSYGISVFIFRPTATYIRPALNARSSHVFGAGAATDGGRGELYFRRHKRSRLWGLSRLTIHDVDWPQETVRQRTA